MGVVVYNHFMLKKRPNQAARAMGKSFNQYSRIWNILAYVMLAIGLAFCLADPSIQPLLKLAAIALSAVWAGWYFFF